MSVFRALLAKTSTVICIFITVMTCHKQTPWVLLYVVMMLFVFSTLHPVFVRHRNNGVGVGLVLFYVLYVINFVQIVFLTEDSSLLHFANENALPYFQFRQTLTCIYLEITSVGIFLYRFLKILGLHLKEIIAWLIYLSIHATVVLLIAEWVFVTIYVIVNQSILHNFLFTFDEKMPSKYPHSFFSDDVLNKTKVDSPAMKIEIFSLNSACNRCVKLQTIVAGSATDIDGNYFPYTYRMATRYVGEDAEFVCSFGINLGDSSYKETFWTINDRRIWNKTRLSYKLVNRYFNISTNMTYLTSTLRVQALREADFGHYKCIVVTVEKKMCIVEQYKAVVAVYQLVLLKKSVDVIYKSIGNLIATETFFLYHTFEDTHEVYFEYSVNGRNVDQECPGFNDRVCSLGTGFLLGFKNYEPNKYPFLLLNEYMFYSDIKSATTFFCLCGKAFGLHKITFMRKLNLKNGKERWIEAENPFVFVVLPEANKSLFREFNDTYLYKDIEDLLAAGANETTIQNKINEKITFIDAYEQNTLRFANMIQSLITLFSFTGFIIFLTFTVKYYCYLFIRIPALRYIHRLSLTDKTNKYVQNYFFLFDIFISHSGNEDIFVKNKLLPFLEECCNQNVCFPERDLKPGVLETQQYTDYIPRCRKVIVLLSRGYKKDALCHNFQLERIGQQK